MEKLNKQQLIELVADLLLNKVDDFQWNYFDISVKTTSPSNPDLLHTFKHVDGKFKWPKEEEKPEIQQVICSMMENLKLHPEIAKRAFQRIFDMDKIPN